jgi:rod shape-determining protein MreC
VPRGAARSDSGVDTLVAAACAFVAIILLILPDAPRDRVAGVIRGNLIGPLAAMQARAVVAGRAFAVNDSLQQLGDSVLERSMRLDAVEAENERLRGLLGLGRALEWGYTPAEALVGRTDGAQHTLLLSAGASQGVERLSAVVAADGLVGMVEQVDARTSVAIIWPHPDFRVSATTPDGGAFGIVTAHRGDGVEDWLLEMHGVPYRAVLRAGTPVVSSGLGGIFPRGVMIGTVIRELRTGRGWARSYVLRPAVRPSDITSVMILAPNRATEGVESVWGPQAEAAMRRIRAVADSLAALQAKTDTTAADSLPADTSAVPDTLARPRPMTPGRAP